MTTRGKITCPTCGGIIDQSCGCVDMVLNGERRRVRFHSSGRFAGPIFISEKAPLTGPEDPDRGWFNLTMVLIVLSALGAIAALVIVFAP